MPTVTSAPADLRARWRDISARASAESTDPDLSVALLASYTIDPLLPYLGVALDEHGISADLAVGPYNQIVQQCLDDGGAVAGTRPDVLVVAPRWEELDDRAAGELTTVAGAALAAAERWSALLVFVLPAVPSDRTRGVGDAGDPAGVVANASRVREALRDRLAGRTGVYLVDCDEAVRLVGERDAYQPSLYRFARIPYSEEVFAHLGASIGRLLRLRYRTGYRTVVLDGDSLFAAGPAALEALGPALRALHDSGTRIAVRGTDPDAVWDGLVAGLPAVAGELLTGWAIDDRPVAEQVHDLGGADSAVLVTTDLIEPEAPIAVVRLGDVPERWPDDLARAGVFDALPAAGRPARPARPADVPAGAPLAGAALDRYIAGLGVEVEFAAVEGDRLDAVTELVDRAMDMTLGAGHDRADLAGALPRLLSARVRDRLGDYGLSAVSSLSCHDGVGVVSLFSVSCPAMGRGVEDAMLGELVGRAAAAGCHALVLRYHETGRNDAAVRFVTAAADRVWRTGDGTEVDVRAERVAG